MRAFAALLLCAVMRPASAQYEDLAANCAPTDSYLNAVMEVVNQQAIMLEDQVSLFERVVGGPTGYALNTTSTLMLSPDYWQALGTSFVDMDGNGIPDAWEDGVLSSSEITNTPGATTMLTRLAAQVARQNGLSTSTVSVLEMSAGVDTMGAGRRLLQTKQSIPVDVTWSVGAQ